MLNGGRLALSNWAEGARNLAITLLILTALSFLSGGVSYHVWIRETGVAAVGLT
jgi:hypothetical protein